MLRRRSWGLWLRNTTAGSLTESQEVQKVIGARVAVLRRVLRRRRLLVLPFTSGG